MPERSEWLVAEGERSVTLGIMPPHHYAKNANITFLGICFRVLQTLFFLVAGIPGVALTLNPRLRALGLKPSAFNLSGWIPSHTIAAIIDKNNTVDTYYENPCLIVYKSVLNKAAIANATAAVLYILLQLKNQI